MKFLALSNQKKKDLSTCILAISSWAICSIPPLRFIYQKANLPTFYSENIGYHFFWSMRFIDGEREDLIIPSQGALMALIQNGFYLLSKHLNSDLITQIHIFGYITIGLPLLLLSILFYSIAADFTIPKKTRFLLILSPAIYSITHAHLFSYQLYPDYHSYVKVALLFTFYFFIKHFIIQSPSRSSIIKFGIITGSIAALKIPLGIFPLLLAFPYLLTNVDLKNYLRSIFLFICSVAITFIFIFLLLYWENPTNIIIFFQTLYNFSSNPLSLLNLKEYSPFESWSEHNFSNLPFLLGLLYFSLIAKTLMTKDRSYIFFLLTYLLLGSFAIIMCIKRGGGASYLDTTIIITLLIVAINSEENTPKWLTNVIVFIFIMWPISWVVSHSFNPEITKNFYKTNNNLLPKLGIIGDWQRTIYNWNREKDLKIYAMFPSNSYVTGTIEDMIMRGFSNFSDSWYTANNNKSLKKLFPEYYFGSYDIILPKNDFVFMFITSTKAFPLVDEQELIIHNRHIARLLSGYDIKSCIEMIHPLFNSTVKSCVVGPVK